MIRTRAPLVTVALLPLLVASPLAADAPDAGQSKFVHPGANGRLVYLPDAQGNVIPDFSNCGYRGGGVALPRVGEIPVRVTLKPGGGDDGAAIQAALDQVAKLPPDARGIRGAVLLGKGRYPIAGAVHVRAGGTVLRGEGDGPDGTVLVATGTGRRALVNIGGVGGKQAAVKGDEEPAEPDVRRGKPKPVAITDAYVPVGARAFTVADAAPFKVGDEVIVRRPSTAAWIRDLGMDRIPPRANGGTVVQWAAGSKDLEFDRVITAIDGRRLTVDAPVTTALDARYGGGSVYAYNGPARLAECGVENLRGVSEFDAAQGDKDEEHAWTLVAVSGAVNCWVRNVTAEHFANNAVALNGWAKWVTVQDAQCLDPISQITGGRRYSFAMNRCELCLVTHCFARNGRHDYVMGSCVAGPNAFVDCRAEQTHADIGPHHRWSCGVLWDGILAPDGQINLQNRGNMGSGHGWAGANQVVWNCTAKSMIVQDPPTAQNWAIGCTTQKQSGDGHWESPGRAVEPRSLYLAQLKDRLGPQAAGNAGK